MHAVPNHATHLSISVVIITVIFCLLGALAPTWLAGVEPYLVLGLMLVIGLPHGATDHGLFEALPLGGLRRRGLNFYLTYFLIIGGYLLLWFVLPALAFVLFMLLSVYHFGQSNWADVDYRSGGVGRLHYVMWGCGILLTPILWYGGEAAAIVAAMTDLPAMAPDPTVAGWIVAGLAALNLAYGLWLYGRGTLDGRRFLREIFAYGLLVLMFYTNSLLLGFTIYFVFWHSLGSLRDQLAFFRSRVGRVDRRRLYLEMAVVVLGAAAFCAVVWFGPGPEAALRPDLIGWVFIFISVLTLPHMLLVEQLYREWPLSVHAPNKNSLLTSQAVLSAPGGYEET